ncbi:Mitochondrial thiamine pyrophosphate carrier 1 [Porphyridium purpureum]|uniref:Mitochondrial thiamine pyrophosphate carrier 1 n=1 Tax=Porphyridium purpureum TaxID=35688 RepID=A0A5J4YQ37_PORPP|nr:Mitochondrial thiamine pyrophosphate carrier 1 [Porphyridium purpureum]|eukprot:POR0638..scf295_9
MPSFRAPIGAVAHIQMSHAVEDLVAGAVSGLIARMCIAPLDVVKIRIQVEPEEQRGRNAQHPGGAQQGTTSARGAVPPSRTLRLLVSIARHEGLRALWQGNLPAVIMVVPFSAVQFSAVGSFRTGLEQSLGLSAPGSIVLASAAAASCATLATYPLDLLRTRLAAQRHGEVYRGLVDGVVSIMRSRGVRGLYAGVGVSIVETVPYAVIGFTSYDFFKRTISSTDHFPRWMPDAFLSGALAGLVVKLCLLPLDNLKLRLQVQTDFFRSAQSSPGSSPLNGRQLCMNILRHEGLRAFYRGFAPTMLKTIPNSAIHFGVYEAVKRAWRARAPAAGEATTTPPDQD